MCVFAGSAGLAAEEQSLQPVYAEAAYPVAERTQARTRMTAALAAARARAEWTDVRVERAFAVLPDDALRKVRTGKRRFLRVRALDFAARYLERGDATGLGFAERALDDARVLDGLLAEEMECLAKSPEQNNPVILNVRDFGAKGDGRADDASAFVRAAEAVRRLGGRPSILKIPAGTYRMGSLQRAEAFTDSLGEYNCHPGTLEAQMLFAGLENCSIEGDGPERTFVRGGVYGAPQAALVNCRNVRLKGLEFSLEQTPFIEGTVDRFDFATGVCELTLKPGSLVPDHPGWDEPGESFGYLFDDNGRLLPEGRLLPWKSRKGTAALGGSRWWIVFDREDGPWYWDRFVKNIRPGLTLVLPNRRNVCGGVYARFCAFCTFEDVWVRNSRASAFCTVRSRATTLYRCRDFPRKGFSLSSNADGCFCEPGTFVYKCVFDSMGDDGLNSLVRGVVAERGGGPTEVVASDAGIGRGGDLLVFEHPHTAQYLANARLVQTDALVRRSGGWARASRFERQVPEVCYGTFLYHPNRVGIGTVVSGCTFRNGRLAGSVIQTSSSLVENNTYENFHEGLRVGALGDYKEGPPPYNVLIRGNRFSQTAVGLTAWLRMCDATKTKWFDVLCAPIRGLNVQGNTFTGIRDVAIDLKNVGDSVFADNAFVSCADKWRTKTCEDVVGPNPMVK